MSKPVKNVKKSPYTSIALAPITPRQKSDFRKRVKWLVAQNGLRWLEQQFTYVDDEQKRRVFRSFGWFSFIVKGEWDQVAPLVIDYLLIESIYNREHGAFKMRGDTDRAVMLITQAMALLRPAIRRHKRITSPIEEVNHE